MRATERVTRTQHLLGAAAIAQAAGWGVAAALSLLAVVSVIALAVPSLAAREPVLVFISLLLGAALATRLLWRSRHLVSRNRVALWIEERVPSLNYALITATEHRSSQFAPEMERAVECQDISGATFNAITRTLLPAVAAVAAAAVLLYVSPSSAFGRAGTFPDLPRGPSTATGPAGSRLERIEASVTPPSYTGGKTATLADPASIPALVGSRVVVTGTGPSSGIHASIANRLIRMSGDGETWAIAFVMAGRPAALTLRDRGYERIVVLDPRRDLPPKITLTSPARDTTLRVAQLAIRLAAQASDDIGLRSGYFECLITSGSGEIFNARTVTTRMISLDGAGTGSLSATLDLASLELTQGDVISIRAIAQDVNTLTGPGIATSDTRTLRIARADEYDSVSVEPAAPLPVDTAAMSQRMLIAATEKLVKEKKKISRAELARRAGKIGDLEDRIRKRVEEMLYENEGGGEEGDASAPPEPGKTLEGEESDQVHAVQNPELFDAFNALWAAVRSLQIAEPDSALPPMRVALKALDRARAANRLYLRGMPPRVIVDIARVRMSGKEKGSTSERTPRTATDSIRFDLERRFGNAVDLLQSKPAEAVREFTLMQVQALSLSPQLAAALGDAIDAFRKGKNATTSLLRARRALAGEPWSASGLPAWSGAR